MEVLEFRAVIWVSASLVIAWIVGWLVRRLGWIFGLVDRPVLRSSHLLDTPKGAGFGILLVFVLISVTENLAVLFWLPIFFLSLVSFLGDRKEISPWLRLAVQFLVAILSCLYLFFEFGGSVLLTRIGWYGIPFGVFFLVASANVYNFMDGIDGMAGLNGLSVFLLLTGIGWVRGESASWIVLAAGTAGSCLGFLFWNFPKAKVFMGDVGSVLIGFLFAFYVLLWSRHPADFFLYSALLLPFFTDEALTVWIRLKNGESLTSAHRRHFYQILANQAGFRHSSVSLLYVSMQLLVFFLVVLTYPLGCWAEMALIMVWLCVAIGVGTRIRRFESSIGHATSIEKE